MIRHLRYMRYIARHKWYTFRECLRLRVPLLGAFHDLSKFRPDEWVPYLRYFYGSQTKEAKQDFDMAWLRHIHRNKHHWQHWVLNLDDGGQKVLEIPERYLREMLADWRGASRAVNGEDNVREWYEERRDGILMHPHSRYWIEQQLGIHPRSVEEERAYGQI
jgi:hypothetical protein